LSISTAPEASATGYNLVSKLSKTLLHSSAHYWYYQPALQVINLQCRLSTCNAGYQPAMQVKTTGNSTRKHKSHNVQEQLPTLSVTPSTYWFCW